MKNKELSKSGSWIFVIGVIAVLLIAIATAWHYIGQLSINNQIRH